MQPHWLPLHVRRWKRRAAIGPIQGNRCRLAIGKADHHCRPSQRPNHPYHRQRLPTERMALVREDYRFQLLFVRWGILR